MGEWDKYQRIIRDVEENEEESLSIINEIMAFSHDHPNFKITFVESIQKDLEYRGFITPKQYNALVNIYYEFKMDEEYLSL